MQQDDVKILLVEDNPVDAKFLTETMLGGRQHKFDFTHVTSVAEASAKIEQDVFDVIVLDLHLPDSQGLETVTKIRSKAEKIPIVVLTSVEDELTGMTAVITGAQDFLTKGKITNDLFAKSVSYALLRNQQLLFKEEVVSNVSHELRTPLMIIREAVSQVVEGLHGDVNEAQVNCLNKSIKNIDRLSNIVNNLLEVSKMESGSMDLNLEMANIVEISKEVCSNFEPHFKAKGLTIKQIYPADQVSTYFDGEKIIQVLTNLLSNALKFTKTGGVEVAVTENADTVECRVTDTGRGIEKDDIEKLFGKFVQVGENEDVEQKGSGLGLSICKAIVELHRGEMRAESQVGKGTSFFMTLHKFSEEDSVIINIRRAIKMSLGQMSALSLVLLSIQDRESVKEKLGEEKFKNLLKDLKTVADNTLRRQSDVAMSSRKGIIVMLPNTEKPNAGAVAGRINESFQKYLDDAGMTESVHMQEKISAYPDDGNTPEDLLKIVIGD